MLKPTKRVIAIAAVAMVVSAMAVDAGWRRAMLNSNCGMPSCAVPSCAGCFAPAGCQGPSMNWGMWGCSAPSYVAAPTFASACSGPMMGCSGCSGGFGPSCFQPGCSGCAGYGGFGCGGCGMSSCGIPMFGAPTCGMGCMGPSCAFGSQAGFGWQPSQAMSPYSMPSAYGMGPMPPQMASTPTPAVAGYGNTGYAGLMYGSTAPVPPYYTPMPAQYAPIPPVPAADLVW